MSQDYFDLYQSQKSAAPPEPPAAFPMASAPASSGESEPQPTPFVLKSSDTALPPPLPNPPYASAFPPPPKQKQPFSPIPLLLIAGVAFLFLGGLIFLTNTWATLPDLVRAIALLSVGIISFGVNALAERVFHLPKTGLAFYILGCIFLPMAVAGIGAFSLFGDWFSFDGDGAGMVAATVSATVSLAAFAGVFNYRSTFLSWLSLTAAAGTWWCFACFFRDLVAYQSNEIRVFSILILLCAACSTVLCEWLLRRHKDTSWGKAALAFLLPVLYVTVIVYLAYLSSSHARLCPAVCALLLGILFANPRLITRKFHAGVPGMALCLISLFGTIAKLRAFHDVGDYHRFLFVPTAAALCFLLLESIPQLHEALRKNAAAARSILLLPMLLSGGILYLWKQNSSEWFLLDALLILGSVLFIFAKRHPFTHDTPACMLMAVLVFFEAVLGLQESNRMIYALLLVITALSLLVQAFLNRKLWYFVLSGTACVSMLLLNLSHPALWMLWFGTLLAFGGIVYSHSMHRQLLEKSFTWLFLSFLMGAGMCTLNVFGPMLHDAFRWILLLAVLVLLYLLETVVFWAHERTEGSVRFLDIAVIGLGLMAVPSYLGTELLDMRDHTMQTSPGWGILLALLLLVLTVATLRKRNNLWAAPHLMLLFFTLQHMISQIYGVSLVAWGVMTDDSAIAPETAASYIQTGCYLVLLAGLAILGRVLLPQFVDNTDGLRIDLPLLTGVLPVIAAAVTIDWYPSILFFLFMTVYSLLYLGRLQNRFIPSLMASFFGCGTILLHNIHDPFGLLAKLLALNIKTLQILLYLLPVHLFLFTLLFILSANAKPKVHIVRFGMYCVTMATLLISSMNFGNVADAIILVVFSFLILVGSFAVKRLRWFTLGFAVLVVMTIHLTWEFWTSLHWGIYLFLAGILLIVLASLYEYSARYAKEHPDAPKKKFRLFATWRW